MVWEQAAVEVAKQEHLPLIVDSTLVGDLAKVHNLLEAVL